ncbi:MAG: hypothetical protein M1404_02080 [Acidobacteria bacterium]|nr:hypothetical protein [Acidobacteriota bacterium]
MRAKILKVLGSLLAVALISPVGLLFGIEARPTMPIITNSPTANWADTEGASSVFNNVRYLALKVRREIAPLEFQGRQLSWWAHSSALNRVRDRVNEMSLDLWKLAQMKKKLEPWQQQLLRRMTPEVHEMVYQTAAAIKALNHQKYQRITLAQISFGNYKAIYQNASRLFGSVGTFTHYVHAAQQMAALQKQTSTKATS